MFETNPIESKEYPGYYHFPLNVNVLVTTDGKVKDSRTGRDISVSNPCNVNNKDYPAIEKIQNVTSLLHRLLAITFLKCPGEIEDYQVNHKDGVKANYDLNNLEWVTPSENTIHAYETGLRDDNRPVWTKDLETEKEVKYHSLQAAARSFNTNAGNLHKYLNNRKQQVPYDLKWEVIYDGEEWRGLTKDDIGKTRKGLPKQVILVSGDRKEMTIYESTVHVADDLGVIQQTVSVWLVNNSTPKKYGFTAHYLDDFVKIVENEKLAAKAKVLTYDKSHHKENVNPVRKPVPIKVTDLLTSEVTEWESTESFANSMGAKKNTIQSSVLRQHGRWKHYKIEYVETQSETINQGQPSEKSVD